MVSLGINNGNMQTVKVYDSKLDIKRNILTTPEEAEQFALDRKNQKKKAAITGTVAVTTANMLYGGAMGGAMSRIANKHIKNFNSKLTSLEHGHLMKGEALLERFIHANRLNNFQKALAKATFSVEENIFKMSKMGRVARNGALLGAILSIPVGLIAVPIRVKRAENKLTSQFIENNKLNTPDSL